MTIKVQVASVQVAYLSPVQTEVMPDGILPPLVRSAVVRVVLGDVGVYARQSELLVPGLGDGLHDQLGIGEGWLGLILE